MWRKTLVSVLAAILLIPVISRGSELTGREIMEKQKRLQKTKSEFALEKMILVDRRKNKEVREIKRYSKEVEEDVNRFLIVFLSPPNIRGTALLTWEHKDAEEDQWLYMPARGRMQRIAKGGKKNYFMGTDFAYEDLSPEDLDGHQYNRLEDEVFKDQDCYVVEALPATKEKKRSSGYSKRVMWISKDKFVTLKVDYYDRRGRLLKRQLNLDFRNIEGTIWRPQKVLVNNFKNKHKTLLGTIKREINTAIPDRIFTERFILKGFHTR
nr:outer membrane lipoprotein-sorting protein [Desulfobacterales bacterium]